MKCWIVPSSLFVPGRIMAPVRLTRERETLEQRRAKLEAELADMPRKIADIDAQLNTLGEEYEPFKAREVG